MIVLICATKRSSHIPPTNLRVLVDEDFVYATAHGDNTFTVKAVDRAGNTSAASNAVTAVLWPC